MNEIRFYLDKPKQPKSLIILKYALEYQGSRFVYSTGEKISPKNWDKNKQRVKKVRSFPEHAQINELLDTLAFHIKKWHREAIVQQKTLTKPILKEKLNAFLGRQTPEPKRKTIDSLLEFAKIYVAERDKSKFLSDGTKKNDRKYLKIFQSYAAETGKKLYWSQLGKNFYLDLIDWMYAPPREYSQNYAARILKEVKGFAKEAKGRGLHNNTAYELRGLSIPEADTYPIYLTLDEIYLLYNKKALPPRYEKVRDLFLIACFTGLRVSDFTKLEKATVKIIKGQKVLSFPRTQKTKVGVLIPLHPILENMMKKYGGQFPSAVSDVELNRIIKEICEAVGMTQIEIIPKTKAGKEIFERKQRFELVTNHTARRSFATNMVEMGVKPFIVMQMTGHKSMKTFLKYIRLGKEQKALIAAKSDFFKMRKSG